MRRGAAAALSVLMLAATAAFPQAPEERARIDYEAAKLALAENRPAQALEKLEKVIATLGQLPDLLYLTAQTAFQAGKAQRAQELVAATFAAAEQTFKESEQYKALIALAARLELEAPALAAKEKGYWTDEATGLTWTVRDNGSTIGGEQAVRYCQNLSLGGFSWRQPTIDELYRIYDPSMPNDKPKIKPPIELSAGGFWVWSGTPGSSYSSPSAWGLYFYDGSRGEGRVGLVVDTSSELCVCAVPEADVGSWVL